ncbi:unnamed protein product [Heligmosomoides polygyrus]|uniref:Peptidase_M13 domain-containing protein n=1 Tax=Heligmosomoides polygyrus TaxID=6339 RepID=A0A183FV57_HELPZ|nr:unnamed protein product [Heligmosomoides polygyrus]
MKEESPLRACSGIVFKASANRCSQNFATGLQAAYNAYQQYVEDRQLNEKRLPGLEQFTPNQVFWIMFAHGLCAKESFLSVSEQLRIGLFPPNECRTNQVLRNIPAFAKDFGCVAGQKMVLAPEERCEVWTSN